MRRSLIAGLGGLLLVAATAAACTSDDTPSPTPTPTASVTETPAPTPSPTEAPAAADTGSMLAAMLLIDTAGFHGMDEALNGDAPAIETSWLGNTRRARVAAEAATWTADTEAAAAAFIEAAQALEAALDNDDIEAAAPAATAAHETQHDLSHDAYAALEAAPGAATDTGAALAAIVLIDGAGFHGMDEALNGDAPEINTSWVGSVNRARIAAQAVAWPADVQPAADAFIAAATDLHAALDADDVEAAAPHAIAAHETQHDLSHDAYAALGNAAGSSDSAAAVIAAIALIDGAGFHGMDDALNGDAPAIDSAWVGRVNRARIAAQAVAWPADVQPAADAFIAAATDLHAALDADDVEAAAPHAIAAHETQHDLSHDVYEALGGGGGGGH